MDEGEINVFCLFIWNDFSNYIFVLDNCWKDYNDICMIWVDGIEILRDNVVGIN